LEKPSDSKDMISRLPEEADSFRRRAKEGEIEQMLEIDTGNISSEGTNPRLREQ
jgi:hypothetical protein